MDNFYKLAEHASESDQGQANVTRRGLLTTVGALALATAATSSTSVAAADDKGKGERTFEGESTDGKLQEALDGALKQLGKALAEGGIADALATWKLAGVTGQRGSIAGLHTVTATITATRSPEWGNR